MCGGGGGRRQGGEGDKGTKRLASWKPAPPSPDENN